MPLGLLLVGGCVSEVVETPPPAPTAVGAVVVSRGAGPATGGPVDAYYGSVIAQMHAAVKERDSQRLEDLLLVHERAAAPAWAKAAMQGFRIAADGLAVVEHLLRSSQLSTTATALGATVDMRLRISGAPAGMDRVELRVDQEGGTAFLVSVTVRDTNPFAEVTEHRTSQMLAPPEGAELRADDVVELPFRVDAPAADAVIREIAVQAELLPGFVRVGGRASPVQRTRVASFAEVLYPSGVDTILRDPLRTLRNAVALGDRAHFGHQFLAACFMPAADRAGACSLLMERVRLGDAQQRRVAMAALARMTGESIGLEDRDGWLVWWQRRVAAVR